MMFFVISSRSRYTPVIRRMERITAPAAMGILFRKAFREMDFLTSSGDLRQVRKVMRRAERTYSATKKRLEW